MADAPVTPQSGVAGEDLYPFDEDGQTKILRWVQTSYQLAKDAKQGHQDKWEKYYKMYRSYVKRRAKGDWRSRVWIPISFYVIETITPRLVAQLPSPLVKPVGPEDTQSAEVMEQMLLWAAEQSDLYLELVKALKSALMYGTGILKTSYEEVTKYQIVREPILEEQTAQYPTGEYDLDGNAMTQEVSTGSVPTGEVNITRKPYVAYQGPIAEAVDIANFFVDPIADSIENARYVIHRVYRDKSHIEDFFNKGIYKKPPAEIWDSFISDYQSLRRLETIGLGPGGSLSAQEANAIQLLEVWTDKMIVTVAGGDESVGVLLRAEANPYMHAEKPFVRIVDHLVPHEFWGIGELEPLEGLQDVLNKVWNNRIDNVKLVLNTMFLAVMDYVVDPSDLQVRPGGIIRVQGGVPLDQAVKGLELGEVTQSSYNEAQEIERMVQQVSGVSPYTSGNEGTQAYNRTATGVALISEQGNTRFSHKIRIAELTGFKRLFGQFGQILQQFMPPEMVLRMTGELGGYLWQQITADSIGGKFDYDIEAESSTQTESVRREQALSLFQLLAADPYMKPLKLREDILKVFGRKNVNDYLMTPEELQQAQEAAAQQQMAQMQAEQQGGEA
jgi:hypothetical protein